MTFIYSSLKVSVPSLSSACICNSSSEDCLQTGVASPRSLESWRCPGMTSLQGRLLAKDGRDRSTFTLRGRLKPFLWDFDWTLTGLFFLFHALLALLPYWFLSGTFPQQFTCTGLLASGSTSGDLGLRRHLISLSSLFSLITKTVI